MDSWSPIEGGGQVHVREIGRVLCQKYNCMIDLFTRKFKDEEGNLFVDNEELFDKKFRVLRSGTVSRFSAPLPRILWLFIVMFSVWKKHRRQNYNLIHAHAFLPGISAKILSLILKIPVVYTVHGTSIGLNQKGILPRLERYLVCGLKYDREISVSKNLLKFKNVNKNIVVIPNGVDVSHFDRQTLKKFKIFSFLYVGRFDRIKGVANLIKAFALISALPIRLDLVGYGYDEKKLKKIGENIAHPTKIHFWGKLTGEKLIKMYKKAHVFVLPSLSEGQPLTILEAWASKIPVIATKVGDNDLFVEEKLNGFLVEPNNITALSEIMKNCYYRRDLTRMGHCGYDKVKKKYSWNKAGLDTYSVYLELWEKKS